MDSKSIALAAAAEIYVAGFRISGTCATPDDAFLELLAAERAIEFERWRNAYLGLPVEDLADE